MNRNPHEPEFHQTLREVPESLMPFLRDHPRYLNDQILERMTGPDPDLYTQIGACVIKEGRYPIAWSMGGH